MPTGQVTTMVLKTVRKLAVLVIGGTALLLGIVMLVMPGPGTSVTLPWLHDIPSTRMPQSRSHQSDAIVRRFSVNRAGRASGAW